MATTPPFSGSPVPSANQREPIQTGLAHSPLSVMAQRWSALHQAGDAVAALAGLPAETLPAEMHDFPAVIYAAGGWRRALAEQGLADLAAIMEPGLTALLAIHERGMDPSIAAGALWDEFHAARSALLALVPPTPSLREHALT